MTSAKLRGRGDYPSDLIQCSHTQCCVVVEHGGGEQILVVSEIIFESSEPTITLGHINQSRYNKIIIIRSLFKDKLVSTLGIYHNCAVLINSKAVLIYTLRTPLGS